MCMLEYGPTYRWKQQVVVAGVESGMVLVISGVP